MFKVKNIDEVFKNLVNLVNPVQKKEPFLAALGVLCGKTKILMIQISKSSPEGR